MPRHFLLAVLAVLLVGCGGTTTVTPQGGTTTNEPVAITEPNGLTTSVDGTPSATTAIAVPDTAQDAEVGDPDSGTSTTQSTLPAPTTTEAPTASAPVTSTTTTLLNAPESFQPDTKLDYSSAQPDA